MRIISGSARGTKLYTLKGIQTRPTLDRIKESLFSIIQNKIPDSVVLDLFAGSGALGLETLSRGAKNCVFCDELVDAIKIVKQNIEKTRNIEKSIVYNTNFKVCLGELKNKKMQFDIIFLDPPYESNLISVSVDEIIKMKLLKKDGIIIAETDNEEKVIEDLKNIKIDIYKSKKYGRVKLLFLTQKG